MAPRTIWLGAVAYDPKVVTIWEGMRRYFQEESRLDIEIVLFQTYEAQVSALLAAAGDPAPRIDIAWNTNLAFVQAREWSAGRCRPLAMRDADLGWTTVIVAPAGGAVRSAGDLRGRVLALGSRDSGHAAILPAHFLALEGFVEGRDFQTLRFNTDVGKHGDTGASEVDVLRAVLDGRADAGDRVIRRIAFRGFATTGVALSRADLVPEITITAAGVYWHPVGAEDDDLLVTTEIFPLAAAFDAVREGFARERAHADRVAAVFRCA